MAELILNSREGKNQKFDEVSRMDLDNNKVALDRVTAYLERNRSLSCEKN